LKGNANSADQYGQIPGSKKVKEEGLSNKASKDSKKKNSQQVLRECQSGLSTAQGGMRRRKG